MAWCWGDNKRKLNVERLLERAWYPLETAVESHIESIYIVLTSLGSEPADIGPTAIEDAIQNINDSIYAKLQSLGQTPVDKKINSLNAKIQALTEISWYYNVSGDDTKGRFDLTNVAELSLTSWNGGMLDTFSAGYYDAAGNLVSSETKRGVGVFTIPSGIKSVYFTTLASSSSVVPTVRFKYQTKVLR